MDGDDAMQSLLRTGFLSDGSTVPGIGFAVGVMEQVSVLEGCCRLCEIYTCGCVAAGDHHPQHWQAVLLRGLPPG